MRLLAALALALVVFAVTHFTPIPGGLTELRTAIGGQSILDLQPSFSSDEVYARLGAFGETGRMLYQRFTVSTDVIFPLTMAAFLYLFAQFAATALGASATPHTVIVCLPIVWFGLDMTENAMVFAMLSAYPERLDAVGASLGYVTTAKRVALLVAVAAPVLMLAAVGWRLFAKTRQVPIERDVARHTAPATLRSLRSRRRCAWRRGFR
jgi:hypothetical protein